jgi:hypothetical protein
VQQRAVCEFQQLQRFQEPLLSEPLQLHLPAALLAQPPPVVATVTMVAAVVTVVAAVSSRSIGKL